MKAVIVGGGIGGIATAIALHLRGWQVQVLERAASISEVGAGVQISPNGTKVLEAMGVMPKLEASLYEPEGIELRIGDTGRQLFWLPMKQIAVRRWGARYFQIHRADLLDGLMARLQELAGDVVQTGTAVAGYQKDCVLLADGGRISADLIVGADGIHSTIRTQMLGVDTPRFTGNVAWRAVVPVDKLGNVSLPPAGCIWALPGKHAVTTRIRSGVMANFVGIVETENWTEEGWNIEGSKDQALAEFAGYDPALTAIIENATSLNCWALLDRKPLDLWVDGSTVLIGDAAHPMLPSMAQGAVQALEDAYVLADCLDSGPITDALQTFYDTRRKRTAKIQATSAANLRLFHKRRGLPRLISYVPIWIAARVAPRIIQRRNDWIYGHDVTEKLNR